MENVKERNVVLREDKTAEDYIEMFRKAMDFDTQRFSDYEEYMAFYEGKQNFLSSYTGEKPWVVDINTVYASDAIDLRVASLLANDYKGELEPLSVEDVVSIENLNEAYSNFWDEMNMDKHITSAVTTSAIVREAYTHIIFENERVGSAGRQRKGKLVPYSLDTASVLIDPNAKSLKEADYVIVRGRISPQKVMDQYPEYDFERKGASSMFSPYERGEIAIEGGFTNEQEDVLTQLIIYEIKNNGKKNQELYKTVLVESQIVEPTKKMKTSLLPIAQLRWLKKHHSPYGLSLMDRLIEQQKAMMQSIYVLGALMAIAILFNTLLINLSERDAELATLRVLGASRTRLAIILTVEHMFIGLVGGLAGALASVGFYSGVASVSSTWIFHIPVVIDYTVFSQIIGFVLFAALLTTPVGIYRIGRMNLLEVVARHER